MFLFSNILLAQDSIKINIVSSSKIILPFQRRIHLKVRFSNMSDSLSYVLNNIHDLIITSDSIKDNKFNRSRVYIYYLDKNGELIHVEFINCKKNAKRIPMYKNKNDSIIKQIPIVLKPKKSKTIKYKARFLNECDMALNWYKYRIMLKSCLYDFYMNKDEYKDYEQKYNAKLYVGYSETEYRKFLYFNFMR